MFLLLSSFLAGMLTSLAPCMLTLLPVIVGNAVVPGQDKKLDQRKPYVIAASLGVSVILFTLILKASTVLIGIDPKVWYSVSGGIVILLGVTMLFPGLWAWLSVKIGLEQSSSKLLAAAHQKSGLAGQILTGAALGPVFSGCSPIYALILATILPVNLALGMIYIIAYGAGLSLALLVIALAGRKLTAHLGWTANPNGWFRRGLAIILILVGLAIIGGYDKKFQTWALEKLPFDVTNIEQKLIPKSQPSITSSGIQEDTNVATFNIAKPYQAPELRGIQSWINGGPQTLEQLKGKVVLVDFWTYSCINCIRTQPYLNAWHDTYKDTGLVILGIHAPEFAFEKVAKNVEGAVTDAKIKYPVGLDNEFATWRAYNNKFWPAKYLIDKNGLVRYTHFGEGEYRETEAAIQTLLKEAGQAVAENITSIPDEVSQGRQTPETYLGLDRMERFASPEKPTVGMRVYTLPETLSSDSFAYAGTWVLEGERSTAGTDAELTLRFRGNKVFLVMAPGNNDSEVRVTLDGHPVGQAAGQDVREGKIIVDTDRLYDLIDLSKNGSSEHTLQLMFSPGIAAYAFTFGS